MQMLALVLGAAINSPAIWYNDFGKEEDAWRSTKHCKRGTGIVVVEKSISRCRQWRETGQGG
jgi:hypothetical protein